MYAGAVPGSVACSSALRAGLRDIRRWCHVTMLALNAPYGKPRRKYGQKAVGIQEQRDPV